jgi:hypothetical protein
MELKTDIDRETLTPLMGALSCLKMSPNAYDITVNPHTLFGVTTGYQIILKTKKPEVIVAAINAISQ